MFVLQLTKEEHPGIAHRRYRTAFRYGYDEDTAPNYSLIGDPEIKIAKLYDMLPAEAGSHFCVIVP